MRTKSVKLAFKEHLKRYMSELGRKGGLAKSKKKSKSSQLNGKKGGRHVGKSVGKKATRNSSL